MKIKFSKAKLKFKLKYSKQILRISNSIFWFLTGALLALFFLLGFSLFLYQKIYDNKVYPGVYVDNVNFGGKSKQDVAAYFSKKNSLFKDTNFILTSDYAVATLSAKQISFGYDTNLSADQAYSIGRSGNLFSDIVLITQAYVSGVRLPISFTYNQNRFEALIIPLKQQIDKNPVDAVFTVENNRVTTFIPSSDGQTIDMNQLNSALLSKALSVTSSKNNSVFVINVPIKTLQPNITTEKANNMGIKELIGEGHSLFYHSIASRIYNINLGAKRINGILVAPGEIFSFDKALGDVSALTGYKQAYIIQNGKTILGDGGGICQVSTTFFRAILNAGLPVVERHAHAYRVGYYEEDSPPGIDATIFTPSVDLKFKNDTGHYILIQSEIDLNNDSLAFYFYGTKDGRETTMTKPVVTNITPAPPDLYQDDPTLPKGEIKQTDFAAAGADVYFTRTVTRNGKTIIYDKFVSDYQPWQAIYLRGTKE